MEKLFYESRPFLFVIFGLAAFGNQTMLRIGRMPALLLIACGALIIYWRVQHRYDLVTRNIKK